jgi:hypothetical protein
MAQVTIYLEDELLVRTRAAAEAAGLSVSAWMARLVRERTRSDWPEDVAALAGAWRDLPLAEELRASHAEDLPREEL